MAIRLRSIVFFALLTAASAANAQLPSIPNCGSTDIKNDIWQHQPGTLVLKALGSTTRTNSLCVASVQVEISIDGVAGGPGIHRNDVTAAVTITRYADDFRRHHSFSNHWWIWFDYGPWSSLGNDHDETDMEAASESAAATTPRAVRSRRWRGRVDEAQQACTPILVDTTGQGYRNQLTSLADGVSFDMNADGVPDRVAWTPPDSHLAWLAIDHNGNGMIDDCRELFGNCTAVYADNKAPYAANGFDALKFAEGPHYGRSKADFVIDANDGIWQRLLLRYDRNHNGLSEPDELQRVSESGLVAIDLDYKRSRFADKHGNEFRLRSTSVWRDGRGRRHDRKIWDVWLVTDGREEASTTPDD